jgi:transcriptional regulator with XRE-family HTH domain
MVLSPVDIHIGKKLKTIRTMSGMTQDQLGELIGVTFQQIQKYEKGLNRISAGRIYELAQVFGKPVSAFFNDYIPDKDYHNFEHKKDQDHFVSEEVKNREIIGLIKAFNRISKSEVRKNVITLLNSISE